MTLTLLKPLPTGAEYLAPVVERVGEASNVSPYVLLGIVYAESNFGFALKPQGPKGSGDYIARLCTPDRDAKMAKFPLPGVVRKNLPDGIKARAIAGPCDAWVPTTTGWGCGLFQIDYEAHYEFAKSGAWADPEKACGYAAGILKGARASLAKNVPSLKGEALDRAMIAAYNAGAGRIGKFLKEGKDIDKATFHPGYIDKIIKKAIEFGGPGCWLTIAPTA
jgi:hypothetical protein